MKCLLVAGGTVSRKQLLEMYEQMQHPFTVGVDHGTIVLTEAGIKVDMAIGDFDSVTDSEKDTLKNVEVVEELNPVKDDTDTEHAVRYIAEKNFDEVVLMGCTGTRLDHTMDSIFILKILSEKDINAYILDTNNKIYIRKGMITFNKESLFGKYISILPYSADTLVSEIRGFKYNADNLQLIRESGRGISNELPGESGYIKTDDYIIIMETKD